MNNAEVIDIRANAGLEDLADTVSRIQAAGGRGQQPWRPTRLFGCTRATGLKAMLQGQHPDAGQAAAVSATCSTSARYSAPLGLYNCPVYRNQDHGRLGDKNANAGVESYDATRGVTADLVKSFNATVGCEKVTCLYNDVNWWIEKLIANPEELGKLSWDEAAEPDYFL